LPLKLPRIAINVKDTVSKKIEENSPKFAAFPIVVKLGFKYMLDICWVSCMDTAVIQETVENNSGSGGVLDKI
jgi:hypothetical protein